jgi:mono/diheme cytochrome c family protein
MKRSGRRLFLMLLGATTLASSAARAGDVSQPYLSPGWRFGEKGGAAIYAHVCAACHQADGQGAVGAAAYPALAGNANLASKAYLETIVLNGLRGMPALGRAMSDEQVADVINYVRSRFGDAGDVVSLDEVKAARPK